MAASMIRPSAMSCSSAPGGPMSWRDAGRPAGPPGTGRDRAGGRPGWPGMVSTVSGMPRSPISGAGPTSVGSARNGWRASVRLNHTRTACRVRFAAATSSSVTAAASVRLRRICGLSRSSCGIRYALA